MDNIGYHEKNEIPSSKECICNGHVSLFEMEENEYVDSNVCKQKVNSKNKTRHRRYQVNVNTIQNNKEKNEQEAYFDFQSNTSTVYCFDVNYMSLYAAYVFVNDNISNVV